jgi:demethylmenaquinone methyltransferase/2-methoxy-6-polyprenyl-1,4-benzoquinol methylase
VDIQQALTEQRRVLKPGGKMVCLDTTPPPMDLSHLPVRLYLKLVIPLIGGLVARDIKTYRYLPESTSQFMRSTELAECMHKVGFKGVSFRSFMGNSMAIHWGIR